MNVLKLTVFCTAVISAFPAFADSDDQSKEKARTANQALKHQKVTKGVTPTAPDSVHEGGLKQNTNTMNIGGRSGAGNDVGVHGIAPDEKGLVGPGKAETPKKPLSGMQNNAIDTGANNRGTFGDERLNNGRQTDTRDFRGSGSGNDAAGNGDEPIYDSGGTYLGTRSELEKSGKEQNSGGFTKQELEKLKNDQDSGGYSESEWKAMKEEQEKWSRGGINTVEEAKRMKAQQEKELREQNKKKTPREDDMGGNQTRPVVLKGTRPGTAVNGMANNPKGGNDGGGTDPRNETASSSGGRMIKRQNTVEGKEIEAGTGTVDWNKALEINTKVNPGK